MNRRHRTPAIVRAGIIAVLALVIGNASAALNGSSFTGDWETGNQLQWSHLQYEWDRPMSDTFKVVTSPVRQGRYAAQFTVRHGYSPWGWNESTEVDWMPIADQGPGSEFYYAFSTLFPTNWTPVRNWGLFAQFYTERHPIFTGPPPISFDAVGERITLNLNTGLSPVRTQPSFNYEVNQRYVISPSLNKGRWNDFVMRARWAPDRTGILEVWHRVAGEGSFRKVLSLTATPTLRWHPDYGADKIGVIKIGLYRKSFCTVPVQLGCTSTAGTQADSVLYHDGFVRGPSFDDVSRRAFGETSGTTPAPPPPPAPAPTPTQPAPTPPAPPPSAPPTGTQTSTFENMTPVLDSGCTKCSVFRGTGLVVATVGGGADTVDTAYAVGDFGGTSGWAGRVQVQDQVRLGKSYVPKGNAAVVQARDVADKLVWELYVAGADRTLRLWSPVGGLRATSINETTGIVVPNDGSSSLSVEVSAARNDSVIVRVNGSEKINLGSLTGSTTGNLRYLRAGVDHYDITSADDALEVSHAQLRATGGAVTAPAASPAPTAPAPLVPAKTAPAPAGKPSAAGTTPAAPAQPAGAASTDISLPETGSRPGDRSSGAAATPAAPRAGAGKTAGAAAKAKAKRAKAKARAAAKKKAEAKKQAAARKKAIARRKALAKKKAAATIVANKAAAPAPASAGTGITWEKE